MSPFSIEAFSRASLGTASLDSDYSPGGEAQLFACNRQLERRFPEPSHAPEAPLANP
jgi:hypothetical protein